MDKNDFNDNNNMNKVIDNKNEEGNNNLSDNKVKVDINYSALLHNFEIYGMTKRSELNLQ